MKYDERLSNTLHAMLHMAHHGSPMTSELLAICLHTNPVVVRRTMAGLREAGLVTSGRGHGGGWTVARELGSITLLDVHTALGGSALLSPPTLSDNAGCVVEAAVKDALAEAHAAANALLAARLAQVTLADLAKDFTRRMVECASHGDTHATHPHP
ncbi:MAG TPA: Rrf2 family transcriptional regulator [Reyranella sp.]|nr:Rrf2 family transcriptional regulator [Reyranella sp.]